MSPGDKAAAEASMAAAEQSGKLAGMSAEERAAALVSGGWWVVMSMDTGCGGKRDVVVW